MDENKINPELGNENEPEDTQVQPTASENIEATVHVEESSENSEFEQSAASTDESDADSTEENIVADEEVVLAQQEAPKKKGVKIVIGIVVAILLCLVAVLVVAIVGLGDSKAKLSVDADEAAITIDDVEVSAGEFVYMYSNFLGSYSYYYTADQLKEYAIDQLVYVNSLYKKAVEAGYTLSDEDNAAIDDILASVEQQAESYSVTVDEMIEEYYFCDGFTVDMFRQYLEKDYIANAYYVAEVEEIEANYSGENGAKLVEDEYNSNKTAYDLTNAYYYYFDATEENAKADVDAVIAKIQSGSTFDEALKAVTDDAEAKAVTLQDYTMSVIESNFSEEVAAWLFAMEDGKYVNGAGAVTSITADDVIYVIYVENEPARNESIPVTLDYIEVKADTDTTVKTEAELMLAAKATATNILKAFESGETNAEAFAALADEYANGDNEFVTASSFEEMTADGSHAEAVETWAFDASRAVGDYAVVEGDGCYYILFYTAKNEKPVWYSDIINTLLNNDISAWSEDVIAAYEDITVKDEDVINAVVEYVNSLSGSSSY